MTTHLPIDHAFLRSSPLPSHADADDKNARGSVLVVAGSSEVPGAALLAATAALRAGAGKLQIAAVRSVAPYLAIAAPEALVLALPETPDGEIDPACAPQLQDNASKARAVLVGPGMTDEESAHRLVLALLACSPETSFVLDAAAVTSFKDDKATLLTHKGRIAMTPHAGEMATFLGIDRDEVSANPVEAGQRAADSTGSVVAMKGTSTFVCDPDAGPWLCEGGGIGLATSGSGDVLAGIVAGLLARGATPLLATQWGVFLHAEAGRRLARTVGKVGYLARELPGEIPAILQEHSPAI
ncbi:NAD(P)H-hydrate dehydratase [Aureimonas leprariae]|uniref:ADP-dependent (S)-NAD(P)H-hydrate dehydratase n=1 Tax=Plantimonas leprariae TaxID=2615207 RepID=A0A7V7PMM8_9HYPH|nr:NAD(P)H-hydrate dehydratase [Aureimonas leprariae]KAB0678530.1 NAD(P)H-hydrate dehydratase [Aureimonas leprariae]